MQEMLLLEVMLTILVRGTKSGFRPKDKEWV